MVIQASLKVIKESKILRCPREWLSIMGLSEKDYIQLKIGRLEHRVKISGIEKNEVLVPEQIAQKIHLPESLLNWRWEDRMVQAGPFVALYAEYNNDPVKPFLEQTELFKDMMRFGDSMGIYVYVVTPGDVLEKEKSVIGWRYQEQASRWVKMPMPWPDAWMPRMIRVPPRLRERVYEDRNRIQSSDTLVLAFPIQSKWDMYRRLYEDEQIRSSLPKTRLIRSPKVVADMVNSFRSVYVKPIFGTQGQQIYKLKQSSQGIECSYQQEDRLIRKVLRFQELTKWIRHKCLAKNFFLVQETINLIRDEEGRIADYRWLIQKDEKGEWQVTARVARIGALNAIVTNVSLGGNVQCAQSHFSQVIKLNEAEQFRMIQKIDQLAKRVATILEAEVPNICEIGIDVGIDQKKHPWIIEVNPRPGRKMLRLLDPKVRALSLRRPLEYVRYTTGFS